MAIAIVLLTALLALAPPVPGGGGLAVLRPCATAQLRAAVASDEHATLHRELRITLTNASAQACAMDGFPAVRLIDELKHVRISAEAYSREPRLFILSPGQQAAFGLRIATGDGTTSYLTAPTLAIVPPGDVAPLLLNVELPVAARIDVTAVLPAAELK